MSKKKKLPEYKAQYYTDSFTDYTGTERKFTLCAITVPIEDIFGKGFMGILEPSCFIPLEDEDWDHAWDHADYAASCLHNDGARFHKMLKLGIAVQCPEDKYDEEIGKKIAYGKALKYYTHILTVSRPGMINTQMVDVLLKQEAEYFKKNPESYIPSYNERKRRWERDMDPVTGSKYYKNFNPEYCTNPFSCESSTSTVVY